MWQGKRKSYHMIRCKVLVLQLPLLVRFQSHHCARNWCQQAAGGVPRRQEWVLGASDLLQPHCSAALSQAYFVTAFLISLNEEVNGDK